MPEFTFQRRYRDKLQALVFDWAGTLADYGSCAPAGVFIEVFRREGVNLSMAQAREPMGRAKRDHIQAIVRMPAVAQTWEEQRGAPCSEADIDRMYEAFLPLQLAALAQHADLIPGTLEVVAACRQRGLKIGSSTGYTRTLVEVCIAEAGKRGFTADAVVCAEDVPAGRPAPWMVFENAQRLGVYPLEAVVKIDDTLAGIESGLNAGAWAVGVAKSGNEIGLTEPEIAALPAEELNQRLRQAYVRMYQAGAHYVIDTNADLLPVLDDIERRLRRGEKP